MIIKEQMMQLKQNVPFSGNSTITGATSNATGVPDTYSSSLNNTSFTSGYATPEMQPILVMLFTLKTANLSVVVVTRLKMSN